MAPVQCSVWLSALSVERASTRRDRLELGSIERLQLFQIFTFDRLLSEPTEFVFNVSAIVSETSAVRVLFNLPLDVPVVRDFKDHQDVPQSSWASPRDSSQWNLK